MKVGKCSIILVKDSLVIVNTSLKKITFLSLEKVINIAECGLVFFYFLLIRTIKEIYASPVLMHLTLSLEVDE